MAMSFNNALKKLTKEALSNMVIEYRNKFDNMLGQFKGQIYKNGIAALSNEEGER